jgi:hypothetical protein
MRLSKSESLPAWRLLNVDRDFIDTFHEVYSSVLGKNLFNSGTKDKRKEKGGNGLYRRFSNADSTFSPDQVIIQSNVLIVKSSWKDR